VENGGSNHRSALKDTLHRCIPNMNSDSRALEETLTLCSDHFEQVVKSLIHYRRGRQLTWWLYWSLGL
jgi:hypothetical protein